MPSSPLLPGDPTSLGPWRLLGRLGQGGMGVVYHGVRDLAGTTEHAAVKAVWEQLGDDPGTLARFRREIAAVMEVDDPGLTRVLAADLAAHPAWFAAQLVAGETLHTEVTRSGPLRPPTWRTLAVLLLSTLDRIHAHGIVHRDLKPQNVLLGPDGPVIIDFGIAAMRGATGSTAPGSSPRTELWAAPEQLTDDRTSPATDVFSLGLLLAWSATGRHPFADDPASMSTAALMHAILTSEPDLSGVAVEDQPWLAAMLRKPPGERPDAGTLLEDITSVSAGEALALADSAYRRRWLGGARLWWEGAADLGDAHAMLELGDLADEQGDAAAAASWWTLAVAAGEPAAAERRSPVRDGDAPPAPDVPPAAGAPAARDPGPVRAAGAPSPAEVLSDPDGRPSAAVGVGRRRGIGEVVGWLAVATLAAAAFAALGWVLIGSGADDPEAAVRISTRPIEVATPQVGPPIRVVRHAVGDTSACLLTATGRAHCWGSNDVGQLGSPGGDADAPRPVDPTGVLAGTTLTRIAVGAGHACALDSAGRAVCWGANDRGQLGVGTEDAGSTLPVAVDSSGVLAGKRLVLIGAAANTTCALDDAGDLYCWGANDRGQMGNGTRTGTARPISVDVTGALRGRELRRFSIGGEHSCAVDDEGYAYCWGANDRGQLGTGTTADSTVPVPVAGTDGLPSGGYESISAGASSTCGWTATGAVACWGANGSGQLGSATPADSAIPREVAFATPLISPRSVRVNVGAATACLTSPEDGTLCWGANDQGQLGDGSTVDSAEPRPLVGPLAGTDPPRLDRVGVGSSTTCGVGEDGRLWCWGSDLHGLLGDGPG